MKIATITGFTVQDGVYFADFFLNKEYEAQLVFDTTKPDCTSRKLMGANKINILGWKSLITLHIVSKRTINDFEILF
jgi:GDP-D-mannose dehydratase